MNGDFYSSFDRYRSDLFDSIYDYKIRSSDDYWTTASSTLGRKLTFDHDYFIEDEESEKLYMKLSVFDKMARDVLDELDPGHEFLYINGFTNDNGGIKVSTSDNKKNMFYIFDFNSDSEKEKSRFKSSISKWILSEDFQM